MPEPNWETVARAVCNMEGMSKGLKNKALEKYIEDNFADRISGLQKSYAEFMARQAKS